MKNESDIPEDLCQRFHDLILELRKALGIDAVVISAITLKGAGQVGMVATNSLTVGDVPPMIVGLALMQVAQDHIKKGEQQEQPEERPVGATLQ